MIKTSGVIASVCCLLFSFTQAAVCVHDGTGARVCLPRVAKRIITLAPDLAEDVAAIGATHSLVGVSSATDFPASLQKLPVIASYSHLNIEAIIAKHPELILAWAGGNSPDEIARLKQLGFVIYQNKITRWQDITALLTKLGKLTGHTQQAEQLAKKVRQQFRRLEANKVKSTDQSLFIVLGLHPLITLTNKSLTARALTLCGVHNLFNSLPAIAPMVSQEAVLAAKPHWILNLTSLSSKAFRKRATWLNAMPGSEVLSVDPSLLVRFGPRFATGVTNVCMKIRSRNPIFRGKARKK